MDKEVYIIKIIAFCYTTGEDIKYYYGKVNNKVIYTSNIKQASYWLEKSMISSRTIEYIKGINPFSSVVIDSKYIKRTSILI